MTWQMVRCGLPQFPSLPRKCQEGWEDALSLSSAGPKVRFGLAMRAYVLGAPMLPTSPQLVESIVNGPCTLVSK